MERRFLVFSFGTLNLTFVQQLVLAMGNLNEKWALSTPVRIRSQEELNSFIDSVVVIVSPWAMLSTEPKLAYPRRQENEAMSAGLVRAFLLLVLWKGNPGYCLVVFKRDNQQRIKYI